MTDAEFLSKLPEGSPTPSDKEFELIQFVYNHHPSIHPVNGKQQIADLYSEFGMRIICDMLETAKRSQEISDERRQLRARLKALDQEYTELCYGVKGACIYE